MKIDNYNIKEFIEKQCNILDEKLSNYNYGNYYKRQIISSYKIYLKSYINDLNKYMINEDNQIKLLESINNSFINKVLLIPEDQSEIKKYINYIKNNINKLDPLYLNDAERSVAFLINSNHFDILNESLVHKTENYLTLINILRKLSIKLGYNDYKQEYKPNSAFFDDTVPDAIKDAINGVEK